MTSTFSNETQVPPLPGQSGVRHRPLDAAVSNRIGLFLMINSLETGGSERQFAELARSLDSTSFHVHLGCLLKRGTFLNPDGMEHFPLGGSLYRWQSLKSRYRMAQYMRSANVDIAHAFDFYTNLMLIPAARLARIPVVIGSQRQLGDLLTPSKYRAQQQMFRWSDCVVANSRVVRDRLLRDGIPEAKVVVIPNGLPEEVFAETSPALPRTPGLMRVGMIARMNTRAKNHNQFLAAAARVVERFNKYVEFVLVGDGPLRSELEAMADRLGLSGQVRFLGDRRDIRAVLASLDISVLPSSSESLSNAILESMAAGLPVLATRVGGNPELVSERTGRLVAPDDVEALAHGMECLLRDPSLCKQLGREAHSVARSSFSSQKMRERHEELYRQLLERKRWKPRPAKLPTAPLRSQRRLNVSVVAASLRYVGGQSVQADLLVENWRHDAQVRSQLIPVDPPLPRLVSWVERIPALRTLVREPFYVWALWQGLKHAEIAHIFSASYSSFWIAPMPAWFLARLQGKQTLIHYHSGEARDHLGRSPAARSVLAKADLLVVPSGYLRQVFAEFGLRAKVVPNIVDLSQFTFRLRAPLRPHLVCTRGFHPYYGVDIVVRAFANVQQAYPEARLDLVGGGPLESKIRALVHELGLSGVEFTGVASRQEIARFYDRADIFINASHLDNMPVSVLEAFASGTPVVTTAPEGMRFVVDHERTGLLSPPGDADALAQNIVRILRDPQLADTLAHNAREESQKYSWARVREQWLEVYGFLAGQPFPEDSREVSLKPQGPEH